MASIECMANGGKRYRDSIELPIKRISIAAPDKCDRVLRLIGRAAGSQR
jgi:hypothetical protein